jgi:hypothetical protein
MRSCATTFKEAKLGRRSASCQAAPRFGTRRSGLGQTQQIVIIDMNAVEDEVVELVASVLARMAFRLLRQADPRNRFRSICFLRKRIDTSRRSHPAMP